MIYVVPPIIFGRRGKKRCLKMIRGGVPRCKKSVEATSSIGLWSTPDVLVIHLKRFLCTGAVARKVFFYFVSGTSAGPLAKFLPADAYAVYDLFGVINHLGSLDLRPRGPLIDLQILPHVKVSPCSSDGEEEASVAFEESETVAPHR